MSSGLFRKRDLLVFVLVYFSVYFSFFETPSLKYTIEPAWFVEQGEPSDEFPPINYKMVPPIVTDLDGNGMKELVLITKDLELKIFNADGTFTIDDHGSGDIYHPEEIAYVRLYKPNEKKSLPIAMKIGYVDHYTNTAARQQVIIVVRENWVVTCYDSRLNVRWEKEIGHKIHEFEHLSGMFRIKDVAITIAPLSIHTKSHGLVVIGANMELKKDHPTWKLLETNPEHYNAMMMKLGFKDSKEDHDHPDLKSRTKLDHFTMYALDSTSGTVMWRHDGLEVVPEQYSKSLPQNAYRLDLRDLMTKVHHSPGINDWTVFRQSLIDELPHYWHDSEDTSMRIAHFVRRHIGSTAEGSQMPKKRGKHGARQAAKREKMLQKERSKLRNDKGGAARLAAMPLMNGEVEDKGLSRKAKLPHNAAEHTQNPNVVVAHTRDGLEVVALRTGVPITSLSLQAGRLYDDLDGDGVVDSVVILNNPESVKTHEAEFSRHAAIPSVSEEHLPHCTMVVMSGLPPRSQLFNGSLCLGARSLHDVMDMGTKGPRIGGSKTMLSNIEHTLPLVLRKLDPYSKQESDEQDIVVAIHTGLITSYSGSGHFNWQLRNGPTWSDSPEDQVGVQGTVASLIAFDADAKRVDDAGTHNNMNGVILIVGESSMQLIAREGEALALAELPKAPITKPIVEDFDNDEVSDIIIVTEDAILGYHVEVTKRTHGILIALIMLSVVAVVAFVANIQTIKPDDSSTPSHLKSTQGPKKGGNFFQITRSTDEHHID